MSNLGASYAHSMFSPLNSNNSNLSRIENLQIAKLRGITQFFDDTVELNSILRMTPSNMIATEETVINRPLDFISSNAPGLTNSAETQITINTASNIGNVIYEKTRSPMDYSLNTDVSMERMLEVFHSISIQIAKMITPTSVLPVTSVENFMTELTNNAKTNVTVYNSFVAEGVVHLHEYIENVGAASMLYINNQKMYGVNDVKILALSFMVSFYPYLIAKYISYFIRISGDTESSDKPISFLVRQFAVLSMKIYLVQICLLLSNIDISNHIDVKLKQVVQSIVTSIKDEYQSDQQFQDYFTKVMKIAQDNRNTRTNISNISRNIDAAKTNVEKALVNDQQALKTVTKAKTLMIIWLVLLIIFIIVAIALLVLANKDNKLYYYLYIVCGIFVTPVFINGLIQILRK